MVLDPDETRRRIVALRTFRGITQADLAGLMEKDGLNKTDLGKIERGEMELRAANRKSIADHLHVDERWLIDPDLDGLIGDAEAQAAGREDVEQRIVERLDRVERNQKAIIDAAHSVRELLLQLRPSDAELEARVRAQIEQTTRETEQRPSAKRGRSSTRRKSAEGS